MATGLIQLDSSGLHIPDYTQIYEYLAGEFRAIYGEDVYLGPDSIDGQWLAIVAEAWYEDALTMEKLYASQSPTTASGDALSRIVRFNGIARRSATKSTAVLNITVSAGARITNGKAEDTAGHIWVLPSPLAYDTAGVKTVIAEAEETGRIYAQEGTITNIKTPSAGWISVTNPADAVAGKDIETDAELRARQSVSVSLPAVSVIPSISGAIANVPGVTDSVVYENDENITDERGLPPHSICAVVAGGDDVDIATAIQSHKTIGCYTHGSSSYTLTYDRGIHSTIRFQRASVSQITVSIAVRGTQESQSVTQAIKTAVLNVISSMKIGDGIPTANLLCAAQSAATSQSPNAYIYDVALVSAGTTYRPGSFFRLGYDKLPGITESSITVSY